MIKKYKDFIAKGVFNKVLHLDDEWLIKTPLKKDELDTSIDDNENISPQEITTRFKQHIEYMKKNPKFFPEIKKLDKYRVAVRKLDTEKAKEELQYLVDYINAYIKGGNVKDYILDELYKATKDSRLILDELKKSDDPIIEKWYNFIISMKYELEPPSFKDDLDLHDNNIGLEKDGTIKLLDF